MDAKQVLTHQSSYASFFLSLNYTGLLFTVRVKFPDKYLSIFVNLNKAVFISGVKIWRAEQGLELSSVDVKFDRL